MPVVLALGRPHRHPLGAVPAAAVPAGQRRPHVGAAARPLLAHDLEGRRRKTAVGEKRRRRGAQEGNRATVG